MPFVFNPFTGTFDKINTLPTLANGSVIFSDGVTLSQNNAKFLWDNTNFSLKVGEDSLFSSLARIRVGYNVADPVDNIIQGVLSDVTQNLTADGDPNIFGTYNIARSLVATGITSNGALFGTANISDRNNAADLGSNTSIIGGSYSQLLQGNGAKSTSTYAGFIAGFHSVDNAGTITSMYDFWAPPSSSLPGGVVTTRYGIFIEPETNYTKHNWLAGDLLIGDSSYSIPPTTVKVKGDVLVTKDITDSGVIGIEAQVSSNTTADGSNATISFQTSASAIVAAGFTNDKSVSGNVNTVTRGDGTDDGTLSSMTGMSSLLFHNSGASGHTTETYGNAVIHFLQKGTQDTVYDYFSQTVPAGTGVATTHYGLFLGSDPTVTKQNWISGDSKMGGSSFSAPAAALDISGTIIQDNAVNDLPLVGLTATNRMHMSVNAANQTFGTIANTTAILSSGSQNSDFIGGFLSNVVRGNGNDDGRQNYISGFHSLIEHNTDPSGTTYQVFGFDNTVDITQGTVENLYDFYSIRTGAGTINNHFGIYLVPDPSVTLQSWVSGVMRIGGSSYSTPSESLEVDGNAVIDGAVIGLQLSTPSNPIGGYNKLYFKSDDNLYMLNSAGTEVQVNGGGGGGAIVGTSLDVGSGGNEFITTGNHLRVIQNAGSLPTAGVGSGAGTGGSVTLISATDTAGTINLTTTAIGPGSGLIVNLVFGTAFAATPTVLISPANIDAAVVMAPSQVYTQASTTGFTLNYNLTDAVGHNPVFNYFVIQSV